MLVITLEISTLSKEKKKELIQGFTKTASQITGIPERAFIVTIHENPGDNIGVGGELLSERERKDAK